MSLIIVACETAEEPRRTTTLPPTPTVEASQPPTVTTPQQSVSVTNVVDGDTIDVRIAGIEQRVRLILVDTPEVFRGEECFGREASAFTKELLPPGAQVTLERDVSETDRFGRLLRYVYLTDGRMVNELLLEGGYAQIATFPPDVKYVDRFLELQREAREAGRGLWSHCDAMAAPDETPVTSPSGCDPSYPTVCIPPPPPDRDCGEITFRRFEVIGSDPHHFDGDGDGIGCES